MSTSTSPVFTVGLADAPLIRMEHASKGKRWLRYLQRGVVLRPLAGHVKDVEALLAAQCGWPDVSYAWGCSVETVEGLDSLAAMARTLCPKRGGVRLALLDADDPDDYEAFPSSIKTWAEAMESGICVPLPVASFTPRVWCYGAGGTRLRGARAHWPEMRTWDYIA